MAIEECLDESIPSRIEISCGSDDSMLVCRFVNLVVGPSPHIRSSVLVEPFVAVVRTVSPPSLLRRDRGKY